MTEQTVSAETTGEYDGWRVLVYGKMSGGPGVTLVLPTEEATGVVEQFKEHGVFTFMDTVDGPVIVGDASALFLCEVKEYVMRGGGQ